MNIAQIKLPPLSGDMARDIEKIYECLYQLRGALEFMLANLSADNFNANRLPQMFASSAIAFDDLEIRREESGLWIGDKTGENGLLIKNNAAPQKKTAGILSDI